MTRCSVPFCPNNANHRFPKDQKLRNCWLKAIRRDDSVPKNGARICRRHFHRSDYIKFSPVTGLPLQHRTLRKSTTPSVFPWNRKYVSCLNLAGGDRRKSHHTYKRFDEIPARRYLKDDAKNGSIAKELPLLKSRVSRTVKTQPIKVRQHTQETQTLNGLRLFTTQQLLSDNETVQFYTGLDNYAQFSLLLSTLLPMANEIKYRTKKATSLTVQDQFLVLLIKLRRNKPDFEIGKMFGIHKTDVSKVFITWVSFVTDYWSLLDSWPNQNVVQSYMPLSLRRNGFSDAEIPIKPENFRHAEKTSFSYYRFKKTLKFIAGCTPNGITYYALEPQISPSGDLQIKDESSISGTMSIDQKVAKCISMDRLVGSTKSFKILAGALNQIYAPLSSKIFSVCLMICSIKVGIVTVNKDITT